ncbi:MAG: T9SS type A sorting domain-containing protein, partial [Bacteroidetes bacterium]|nr:T9SS type A sorting domain-containing protein [Bacteroidota bacterium]
LDNMTSIGGDLDVSYNTALTSFTGLDNMTSIGGDLDVSYNTALTSLTGLNNVTSIGGDLSIDNNDALTSLTGLDNVTSIGGDIWIYSNDALTSLTGLDNVTFIGGHLQVSANNALTSLTGLENVTSIGGAFYIHGNAALTSFTGLDNMTSIGGDLDVSYNTALTSLSGLENVTFIGGYFYISKNEALTSLSGLESLTTIGGNLTIHENGLTSLTGLDNLTFINGYLKVYGNYFLTSLTGLDNLTFINGDLIVVGNYALTSLTGLENITFIGGGLQIKWNSLLCNCEIEAICAYLTDPNGAIVISDNADGCSSIIEVAVACGTTMPCLYEETIGLYSQFDVDHFPAIFPGCIDLDCSFYIAGNDIVNLDSLGAITSIGGDLEVKFNAGLTSLTGLENVTSIGGDIWIYNNDALSTCDVQSICNYLVSPSGYVSIYNNAAGCNSVEQVAEDCENNCLAEGITFTMQEEIDNFQVNHPGCIEIEGDVVINGEDIVNLNGLDVLTAIGGNLWIEENELLISILGLDNVSSIDGSLHIANNTALTRLAGLGNIEPGSIEDLIIFNNDSLSECDVFSICEYLSSPGSTVQVYGNAPGCNDQEELEQACESHCLFNGIVFSTQEQVDNFQINYPGCNKIEGDVVIKGGNNISNLNGLAGLTFIGGDLSIGKWVAGHVNYILNDISGLSNLKSVAGNLTIAQNHVLSDLTGLDSLVSIGGMLHVRANASLSNLTGLQNINSGSISNLIIKQNTSLSECAIESICDYLAAPNGSVTISNNAPGCNNPEEVEEACLETSVDEIPSGFEISISPNPVSDQAVLNLNGVSPGLIDIRIFNTTGICLKSWQFQYQQLGEKAYKLDLKDLPAGIYFCRLQVGNEMVTKKIIKTK